MAVQAPSRKTRSRASHGAVRVHFDGCSTPNPGVIRTNVHLDGEDHPMAGTGGTAPRAVWLAVFHAFHLARRAKHRRIVLVGDSTLVAWHASRVKSRHSAPIARVIGKAERLFRSHFDEVTVELVDAHRNDARKALGRARSKAAPRPTITHAWW